MAKVAINGLGRIGRATLKIVMDTRGLDLVAANDIGTSANVEYLLKYDTVYGRYEKTVEATDDGHLKVGDRRLTLLSERDPARLPWRSLNVDIVLECTGAFTRGHRGRRHQTDDGGRGEPCVHGGGRERTLSWGPRCDLGSGRLVRHHQRSPCVGCGSRHDSGC